MDWSNDHVIEFIELLEKEPALWNPKTKSYKGRHSVNESWSRIIHRFSAPITIEELKKKKNSLLTQYRDYLKKVKLSMTSESGEIYKPSWFAFETMNSFLGSVYMHQSDRNSEEHSHSKNLRALSRQSSAEIENICSENEVDMDRPTSPESNPQNVYEDPIYLPSIPTPFRKRRRIADVAIESKMEESFPLVKDTSAHKECSKVDECDIYGQLLVQKLRQLEEEDRLRLMNDIDNLAFKYLMAARKRNRRHSSSKFVEIPSPIFIAEACAPSVDVSSPIPAVRRHVSRDLGAKVNDLKSEYIHIPVNHKGIIKFEGLSPTAVAETNDIQVQVCEKPALHQTRVAKQENL